MKKPRKSSQKRTYITKSLSVHPADYAVLKARADSLGMNLSAYLVRCAKMDAKRKGPMVIEPQDSPDVPASDKW